MFLMPRILLIAALCAVPTVAFGQFGEGGASPAPFEPVGGAETSEEVDASDAVDATETTDESTASEEGGPERFDRPGVAPIEGTEATDEEVDAASAADEAADAIAVTMTSEESEQLTAQLQQLRLDMESRLNALEARLDAQIARVETLASTTITARKPAEDTEELEAAAKARDTAVAQLRDDLTNLRDEVTGQLQELADAGNGSDAGAAQTVQRPNEGHRLRIHNSTGAEQPLFVNGVQWTVRSDEWTSVPILRGSVTVHRPGHEPLEITESEIDWQTDKRGYFIDYDLDGHAVQGTAVN